MDAAWKKGAYPGKRVHTLHGLQKKAVRYTQGVDSIVKNINLHSN